MNNETHSGLTRFIEVFVVDGIENHIVTGIRKVVGKVDQVG